MDNIKIDLRETECEDMGWAHAAQNRTQWNVLVDTVMKLLVSENAGNFLTN
jgi:hypothetical protein